MPSDGGLRKLFKDKYPDAHFQPVESWSTGLGVPDTEYCFPGGLTGWVEYKQTGAWAVRISPEQVAWAERRSRVGGRVFLAVRRQAKAGPRRVAVDTLFLYRGTQARAVLLDGVRTPPLATWDGGPGRWEWSKVRALLTETGS